MNGGTGCGYWRTRCPHWCARRCSARVAPRGRSAAGTRLARPLRATCPSCARSPAHTDVWGWPTCWRCGRSACASSASRTRTSWTSCGRTRWRWRCCRTCSRSWTAWRRASGCWRWWRACWRPTSSTGARRPAWTSTTTAPSWKSTARRARTWAAAPGAWTPLTGCASSGFAGGWAPAGSGCPASAASSSSSTTRGRTRCSACCPWRASCSATAARS
mmetsp:Transcript_38013/g.95508  ORF Transcript_38013/g.95508 Transcript_38013/m.95508 type:complete len:217 (+) Transcript_38013:1151-1801(+)